MDYAAHYTKLMERAKNRVLEGYSEMHHIIPKCLGGTDDKENLVRLTAEEHFIAHKLLVCMYPGNSKLLYAAVQMTKGNKRQQRNNNKLYGWLKKEWQARDPWNKGLKASDETRKKLSERRKGIKRQPHSAETKEKMRLAALGKKKSDAHCETLSRVRKGKKLKPHTEETKRKISESNKLAAKRKDYSFMQDEEYRKSQAEKTRLVWQRRKEQILLDLKSRPSNPKISFVNTHILQ